VLGSRLDLRQTGADINSFVAGKKIFHVDIDQAELNNRITTCKTLNVNLKDFLEIVNQEEYSYTNYKDWFNTIKSRKDQLPDTEELKRVKGINPNKFIHRLSKASRDAEIFTTDVGNNQMWTAQSVEISHQQRFLSSGGMGAMGYALPAAIGASFASGNAPTVCISGDGGFQINIQELQTIRRNNLPVKMVILNNHCLGMIRQFQDAYFNSFYEATVRGYDVPDFAKVAKAYNIDSLSIKKQEEVQSGLERLWEDPSQPFLLNVRLDVHTNVCPKMMFGSPITEMEYQNYEGTVSE
jgi:acetolactate synthase-1/2/3 large subunit